MILPQAEPDDDLDGCEIDFERWELGDLPEVRIERGVDAGIEEDEQDGPRHRDREPASR